MSDPDRTIAETAQFAVENLPEGYQIALTVGRGDCAVELFYANELFDYPTCGDSLAGIFWDAVTWAIANPQGVPVEETTDDRSTS